MSKYMTRYSAAIIMGLTALVIAGTADLFAGLLLDQMQEYVLGITGMMILVYSAIGMRGNIFGAMGSRIGTSMNIGTFEFSMKRGTVLRANFDSTIALTLVMSVAMGITTWAVAAAFFDGNAGIWDLIFISSVGGFIAGVIVLFFNIVIAYVGSKRDWDVDNITAPLIAAVGDIVTMPMIFLATWMFFTLEDLSFGSEIVMVASVIIMIATVLYVWVLMKRKISKRDFSGEAKRIFVQSLPVLLICLIFEIGAGITIQNQQDSLIAYSVLIIMMPAFLNQGNALSGMLTSRLSSAIHLGTLEDRWSPRGGAPDFLMIYICAMITFVYIGLISFGACILVNGASNISFVDSILIIVIAGFLATTILNILSYYVAVAATKFGLDPDDHSIPITSSVMDLLGSAVLVCVISLFI